MDSDGFPGVTPTVIHGKLGIGDDPVQTDLWDATRWKHTLFKPGTGYYQRIIDQV